MRAPRIALIVDPYSSGTYYVSGFKKHNVDCIAIQSIELPDHFVHNFDPSSYRLVLSPENDYLLLHCAEDIVAVVAGCDTGVVLADRLSTTFGLDGNDPETSLIRRDKRLMQAALQKAGLRHIPTTFFNTLDAFRTSSETFNAASFVVKPVNSAGSEGVRFVEGYHGLVTAMQESALYQFNVLGEVNRGFVIQPYIDGPEYVVDMVAASGQFFVAAVCQCFKIETNGSRFVCSSVDLLNPGDPSLRDLLEYARGAARQLSQAGPMHMELRCTPGGPVMIVASARLPGAGPPLLYSKIYEPERLSAVVRAYLGKQITDDGGAAFSRRQRLGRVVCLISDVERVFPAVSDDDLARFRTLASYWSHKLYIRDGDRLRKTIDFAACPGVVFLAHDSAKWCLDHDEKTVREIFSSYLQVA